MYCRTIHYCLIVASLTLSLRSVAVADSSSVPTANACDGRLVLVDDPSEVGDNYPIFMKTRRSLYVMKGDCFRLLGDEFHGSITFFPLSRAPQGFNGKVGVMIVKSIRSFSGPIQDRRIKLSRNEGWYLPGATQQNALSAVGALNDHAIDTSIADWNSLYTHPPVPTPELFTGLEVPWHAYATDDKSIYSTEWPDFWRLGDPADFQNSVVTNYLIRYTINQIPTSTSPISFYVITPDSLQRLDLFLYFNSDLGKNYTFLFK